ADAPVRGEPPTLPLHDALPICPTAVRWRVSRPVSTRWGWRQHRSSSSWPATCRERRAPCRGCWRQRPTWPTATPQEMPTGVAGAPMSATARLWVGTGLSVGSRLSVGGKGAGGGEPAGEGTAGGVDGVVLRDEDGRDQWLLGVYATRALRTRLAELAAAGEVRGTAVRALVGPLRLLPVPARPGEA